jgi:phosphohistidine phosphatase SixA
MLVGHLPHLANLTQLLLGGDANQPKVVFRHGDLVGLEQNASGRWALVVVPPGAATA